MAQTQFDSSKARVMRTFFLLSCLSQLDTGMCVKPGSLFLSVH